jgi:hypothetical protein
LSDEPGTRWSQRRKVAKGSEVIGTKVVEGWSARESRRSEVESEGRRAARWDQARTSGKTWRNAQVSSTRQGRCEGCEADVLGGQESC